MVSRIGFATVILIALFDKLSKGCDNCFLTKKSFLETYCVDSLGYSFAHCDRSTSNQPEEFVHWKVQYVALRALGQTIGTVAAVFVANKLGRRAAIMHGFLVVAIATALAISWTNAWFMLFTRLLIGFGDGLAAGPILIWISESFHGDVNHRGRALAAVPMAGCVALVLAALAVFLIEDWRVSAGLNLAPVPFILLVRFSGWWPESPVWLREKDGGTVEPEKSAPKAVTTESTGLLNARVDEVEEDAAVDKCQEEPGTFAVYKDGSMRLRLFVCSMVFILDCLSGSNAVVSYGTLLMKDVGVSSPVLAEMLIYACNLLGTLLSMTVIDCAGRKRLLLGGALGMCVLLGATPLFLVLVGSSGDGTLLDSSSWTWATAVFTSLLCAFLFTNALTVGPIGWVYVSEVFPFKSRAHAVQMVLVVQGAAAYLASYTPYLIFYAGISWSFLVFMFFGLLLALLTQKFVIETAGRSVVQIDTKFRELAARTPGFT